jgi:hypothetical protein
MAFSPLAPDGPILVIWPCSEAYIGNGVVNDQCSASFGTAMSGFGY